MSKGQINSVLGPISPDKLGATLMHEHFVASFDGWVSDQTIVPYQRDKIMEINLKWLKEVKDLGIQTVVDATSNDLCRDPILMRNLSQKSGLNIICATGLYYENLGAAHYWNFLRDNGSSIEEMIYEMMVKEITVGIGDTGVKAGVIKVATGRGHATGYELAVVRAGGRASKDTGVPVITHTEGPTLGPEQADWLMATGANPKQIMIGHMNNSNNILYHQSILLRPDVSLGFDRTGLNPPIAGGTLAEIEATIAKLCSMGYAGRICLSHDYVGYWHTRKFEWADGGHQEEYHYPTYISTQAIPHLKALGVTREQINQIMVENPKRLFTGH